jgi:uncharacterized membrane-anchored protein YhcB (DUF1043 family)
MFWKVLHKLIVVVVGLLIAFLVQRFFPNLFPRLGAAFSRILAKCSIPSPVADRLFKFLSLILGLLVGIFFHYLIYRFTLPTKPFVYVAF